jgi:hypothetical protein
VPRVSIDTLSDDPLGLRVHEDGVRFIEHVDHLVDLWDIEVCPGARRRFTRASRHCFFRRCTRPRCMV